MGTDDSSLSERKKSSLELSEERVEKSKGRIAKCLNILEATIRELQWACESEGWNDEVVFQLEEAATKLGFSLATLYRWDEDCNDE